MMLTVWANRLSSVKSLCWAIADIMDHLLVMAYMFFFTKQANPPQLSPTNGYVSKKVCFRSKISHAYFFLLWTFFYIDEWAIVLIIIWKVTYWQLNIFPNIDIILKVYSEFIKHFSTLFSIRNGEADFKLSEEKNIEKAEMSDV